MSAVNIAREVLSRVETYDAVQPQIWISRFSPSDILAQAEQVDARIARGETLALAGVPFAVKDNIDVEGLPTTAGCPESAYSPERSATVVQRLVDAGAICIGKTNLDQFATGLSGTRTPHGAPGCVFNRAFVSGGSSSGSAVATAAGLVAFALGTDTAGSGRVPAAFNHLIGLKPTKGRWSTRGLVPACRTLDCISAFTSTIEDALLLDKIIAGFDPEDSYSRRLTERTNNRAVIGMPRASDLIWHGDSQSAFLFAAAVDTLGRTGAKLVEFDLTPFREAAALLYSGPWIAERTAAMALPLRDYPGAIDPVVRGIVEAGASVSGVDVFEGIYRLAELARSVEAHWQTVDMIVLPTTPTAYRVAELEREPITLNSNLGRYTNFVNLLDLAALAVPAGFRENCTGFGISFIGPAWTDHMLLATGRDYIAESRLAPPPLMDLVANMEHVKLAVVGAHLEGMPLHWQLTSRGAVSLGKTFTAPHYRLYAMANCVPPKPALMHDTVGGAIEVEIYQLDIAAFGSFVAEVPAPLAIGTVILADGSSVKGFVAEPRAIDGGQDITQFGGWRAFIDRENGSPTQ